MIKRILSALSLRLALIISIIAIIITPFYYFLGTQEGLLTLLKWIPGTLKYKTVEGTLWRGIDATNLSYQYQNIRFQTSHLSFRWKPLALLNNTISLELQSKFQGVFSSKTFSGDVHISVDGNEINFHDSVAHYDTATFSLKGELNKSSNVAWQINIPKLSAFSSGDKGHVYAKGHATGHLSMQGFIWNPKFQGMVLLQDSQADVDINDMALMLNKINLACRFYSNGKLSLEGSLYTKNKLVIKGETNIRKKNPISWLSLKGKNILLLNNEEYYLLASPDIMLKFKPGAFQLTGNIDIPKAKIKPKDFSSTVTLPGDVVYVDKNDKPIETTSNIESLINLGINAQDIRFHYQGLNARLEGNMTLNQSKGTPLQGSGQLNVLHGSYRAYGQNLRIEKSGSILFTRSLTNPQLDIRAIRQITTDFTQTNIPSYQRGLIVGLHVQGTLDQPNINFFSEPAGLNQQDILSYLVFGLSQEQLSNSQSAIIFQALSAADVGGSGSALTNFKKSLQKDLGLTDVGFEETSEYNPETDSIESGTSFVASQRIGKRLTLTYNVGLVVPVNIVYLRYQLSRHVALQTDSSMLGSGTDVLWSFERD
ncbi:MAG: translocation/assembly module TamB domain-containing protein [Gammaproteobacteria bacterium]